MVKQGLTGYQITHIKEILATSIVPQQNTNEKQILSVIDKFYKDFRIGTLLKAV
jgi:hypothetical protein